MPGDAGVADPDAVAAVAAVAAAVEVVASAADGGGAGAAPRERTPRGSSVGKK